MIRIDTEPRRTLIWKGEHCIAGDDEQAFGRAARWALAIAEWESVEERAALLCLLGLGTGNLMRLLWAMGIEPAAVVEREAEIIDWFRATYPHVRFFGVIGEAAEVLGGPWDIIIDDTGEELGVDPKSRLSVGGMLLSWRDFR